MQIQYALILVEGPVRRGQLSEVNTSTLGLVSEVKLDPVENFTIKGSLLREASCLAYKLVRSATVLHYPTKISPLAGRRGFA